MIVSATLKIYNKAKQSESRGEWSFTELSLSWKGSALLMKRKSTHSVELNYNMHSRPVQEGTVKELVAAARKIINQVKSEKHYFA